MSEDIKKRVYDFLKKYPFTIAFRLSAHLKIINKHLNPGEEVLYIFPAQKAVGGPFSTCIVCFTSKRILIAQKRVLPGYNLNSITPDLFNDFQVYKGFFWGKVEIDTAKELVKFTYIDSKALVELETNLSEYLLRTKKEYRKKLEEQEQND